MQTMRGMLHRHITQQSLQQIHTHSHIIVNQEDMHIRTHTYKYTKTQGEPGPEMPALPYTKPNQGKLTNGNIQAKPHHSLYFSTTKALQIRLVACPSVYGIQH